MSRITELAKLSFDRIAGGLDAPVTVLLGRILNNDGSPSSFFAIDSVEAKTWRPAGVAHFLRAKLLPSYISPCNDAEEVRTGIGNKTVIEKQRHHIVLRAPQKAGTDAMGAYYQGQLGVLDELAKVFSATSSSQVVIRMLTLPVSYPVASAGRSREQVYYLIQHFPLAIETEAGELLWEHPRAEAMINGQRIDEDGTAPTVTPSPVMRLVAASAPQSRPAPAATPQNQPTMKAPSAGNTAWHAPLLAELQEDGVPEDRIQEAIRRRRIRFHKESGLSDDQATKAAEADLKALQPPEIDLSWHEGLVAELTEDGVPEERIQDAIRRRRVRFHKDSGLSEDQAQKMAEAELAALASTGTPAKGPKRTPRAKVAPTPAPKATKAAAKAVPESETEASEASQLIRYILNPDGCAVTKKDLAANCGCTPTYIYMLETNREGRKGTELIEHLRLVKKLLDQGKDLPPALLPTKERKAKEHEQAAQTKKAALLPKGPKQESL